jgi:hypothetical protein
MGKTYIAKDIIKTSERIDGRTGDVIDPRTKEILIPAETYMPPAPPTTPPEAPQQPVTQEEVKYGVCQVQANPLSISDRIKQARENLKQLEELKQLKIKELKAQAELLEKE